jgi:hypothetical protein
VIQRITLVFSRIVSNNAMTGYSSIRWAPGSRSRAPLAELQT